MKLIDSHDRQEAFISIVDDEACVRESLGSFIRSLGYETKEYAAAEDFLISGSWDNTVCLILDVHLPGMGGLELQRNLAEMGIGQPTVFISGNATENEQTWATMRGAVAFLQKPFSDESLLKAVGQSIARVHTRLDLDPERRLNRVCPLCHESARIAEVPGHLMLDHCDIRASTVDMIKTLNPEWAEQDGSCHRCWRFYVGLGRVIKVSELEQFMDVRGDKGGGES